MWQKKVCICASKIVLMANYKILMCFSFFSYNKRELNFSTLKEYNDYLEKVEDIGETHTYLFILKCFQFLTFYKCFKCIYLFLCPVFNLTNNIDVEMTKQIMEQYQRDNKDIIQRNKAKLVSMCAWFWLDSWIIPQVRILFKQKYIVAEIRMTSYWSHTLAICACAPETVELFILFYFILNANNLV